MAAPLAVEASYLARLLQVEALFLRSASSSDRKNQTAQQQRDYS